MKLRSRPCARSRGRCDVYLGAPEGKAGARPSRSTTATAAASFLLGPQACQRVFSPRCRRSSACLRDARAAFLFAALEKVAPPRPHAAEPGRSRVRGRGRFPKMLNGLVAGRGGQKARNDLPRRCRVERGFLSVA
ncbi:hypothetical protein TcG_11368 [Trypanosoma cruzi]|nr:hypothetical protein TcG_11368 [Trypanosoma cruzi]